jgi:hypothetical protein
MAAKQRCYVKEVKENGWLIQFKTRLQWLMRDQWYDLAAILNSVHLNDEKDSVYWKWTPSRSFTVKSVYEHLIKDDCGPKFQMIWKAKIPKKTKTFMWLVEQQAILTKDNMLRRKWQGDPLCYFCNAPETVDHLFFECPTAKVICGVIAICFHQNSRPKAYDQFWRWILSALPEVKSSICLAYLLYAGQFGNVKIGYALKRK